MAGYDNIRDNTIHSSEVARARGALGGKAAGVTKRVRKTLREALKTALGCQIPDTSPLYRKVKKMMEDFGMDGEPTVQDLPVLGMIMRASKDHNAATFIRDTIGEKPVETFEDVTPQSPIELRLPDAQTLEEVARRRELRNTKDAQEMK